MRQLSPFPALLACGLALHTAGCATRSLEPPPLSEGPRPPTHSLRVENGRWEDVTVFLVRADVPIRIGLVPGNSTRVFHLPSSMIGSGSDLRFAAGGRHSRETAVSEWVDLPRGQQAVLILGDAGTPVLFVR